MTKCKRCKKPLKTLKSVSVGYGSVCKKKQAAEDAAFLKMQITIYEEFEYQEKVMA